MPRFSVGDIVEYPGYYTAIVTSTNHSGSMTCLTYPSSPGNVGAKWIGMFLVSSLRLYKPALTREQKFNLSKNRVESRHLRNKKV